MLQGARASLARVVHLALVITDEMDANREPVEPFVRV
jgi:hypothetical protein